MADAIAILAAARTPIGGLLGELSALTAPRLGAHAISAALARAGVQGSAVAEVFMGNVLSAGLGQAPARQAAIGAGLPQSVPCTTLNKMCGSGMQALLLAHDRLAAGGEGFVVAGGMESMSQAPFLLPRMRQGQKYGHTRVLDHMAMDGLEDAYDPGRAMGAFAEDTAEEMQITRAQQDEFAQRSLRLALGDHADEIAPIIVPGRKPVTVATDEQPRRADPGKIPTLRPAFREGGTVTAANSSSISDGAAALLVGRLSEAARHGIAPLASIVAHAVHAQAPAKFTTAPVEATRKVLARAGWTLDDVDLFEINEAFAVVALACAAQLRIPPAKLNVRGGACAMGHPIGASGARIVVTLLAALREQGLKRGVAAVCIGGGEATAVAVELL
jgi:acetyl-CoA C-acetyltransferase